MFRSGGERLHALLINSSDLVLPCFVLIWSLAQHNCVNGLASTKGPFNHDSGTNFAILPRTSADSGRGTPQTISIVLPQCFVFYFSKQVLSPFTGLNNNQACASICSDTGDNRSEHEQASLPKLTMVLFHVKFSRCPPVVSQMTGPENVVDTSVIFVPARTTWQREYFVFHTLLSPVLILMICCLFYIHTFDAPLNHFPHGINNVSNLTFNHVNN